MPPSSHAFSKHVALALCAAKLPSSASKATFEELVAAGLRAALDTVYLNEKQVAVRLALTEKTLQKWRLTGEGPAFLKLGSAVRYSLLELIEWEAERQRRHTTDPGVSGHDPATASSPRRQRTRDNR